MDKKKVFLIGPVRGISSNLRKVLDDYVHELEKEGHKVHYPPRDTNQNDPIGVQICMANFKAILRADEIHIWYDENSTGTLFDLGGAFMLTKIMGYPKKIIFINREKVPDGPGKSFAKVLKLLEEETKNKTKHKHRSRTEEINE